ncbi:hypothetical protein FACS189490_12900 [Clostridia bacterium]|nr:hypothetical protein FACS189490_12900 [Clostridia bacterium]
MVEKYSNFKTLDFAAAKEFIQKVIVHAPKSGSDRHKTQKIRVIYNFIGEIELADIYKDFAEKLPVVAKKDLSDSHLENAVEFLSGDEINSIFADKINNIFNEETRFSGMDLRNQTLVTLLYETAGLFKEILRLRLSDALPHAKLMSKNAQALLNRYIAEFHPEQDGGKFLFYGRKGNTPLSASAAQNIVISRGQDAGLTRKLTPQLLRDTRLVRLFAEGAAMDELAKEFSVCKKSVLRRYEYAAKKQ